MSNPRSQKKKNMQSSNSKQQNVRKKKNVQKQQQQSFSKPMKQAVASSIQTTSRSPQFKGSLNRPIIKHSELVGPIVTIGNSTFKILKNYRLNPASQACFKWLSQIATSWEFYRWKKLEFRYVTRSTTSQVGSIIMGPDYDSADQVPLDEQELSTHKDTKEASIWKNFSCRLNQESLNALYKKRTTMDDTRFATTTQDKKTIDSGRFYVAEDASSTFTAGKLWVDYEVEFENPQPITTPPNQVGGGEADKTAGLGVSPVAVFQTSALNTFKQDSTIMEMFPDGTPSNTFVKFLKDFQGLMAANVSGTSLSSLPGFTLTGLGGLVNLTSNLNGAQTLADRTVFIDAKVGDKLSFGGPILGTAVTGANFRFGSGNSL